MANVRKRLSHNVEGEFFVDSTCIDCDACRQLAPETFKEFGEHSVVSAQPRTEGDERRALRALLACPTGSIGTLHRNHAKEVIGDFPLPIEDEVYYSGFNSPKSYGGSSYFVQNPGGNWLIDSPRYTPHLVRRFAELGGIQYIFLTHRDDVADADKYARRFSTRRIIHRAELSAQPDAEIVLDGHEPVELHPAFLVIPTPGHTRGHSVLLYRRRFLFTGDHLWWDPTDGRLDASEEYCWYSWQEQARSMASLRRFTFEWVLPGHGHRVRLPSDAMHRELSLLVDRMSASV
jgi:glyoxylase-like metal-dependent hydrolase (beta-lactamase superfamily II)/ferredoxin